MPKHIDEKKRCEFVKPDGSRCDGFKIKNSQFCYSHSPKEIRRGRSIKARVLKMEQQLEAELKNK